MRDHIRFYLNGSEQIVRGDLVFATLAEYLRSQFGLAGTKIVCAEGDCGACTVLVGRLRSHNASNVTFALVDACIQFVFQLDGTYVLSVEGLATTGELHPVQQALVDCHGSQCGFCTPGFVMALAGWADGGATMDRRIALTGNLCRCTGYVPILEAANRVRDYPPISIGDRLSSEIARQLRLWTSERLSVRTAKRTFFAPTRIDEAIEFKAANPETVIVAGATELAVQRNKRGFEPAHYLSLSRIAELDVLDIECDSFTIGANVTWSQIETAIRIPLPQFVRIVERFGSPQIRNVATVIGNVANGSPIADSLPLLLVMNAELEIVGPQGLRRRPINGFYSGYKRMDLRPDELIARVILPLPSDVDRLRLYKVSRRTDLDIATFGAAIRLQLHGERVSTAAIAFSGVAPTVIRLPKTEQFLVGQYLDELTFHEAGKRARNEVLPITDVRGSADFRMQLCENVLRKFYVDEVESAVEANA